MIRLPAFRYFAPRTLDEAIALLRDHGPDAMPVAGGTDLFPNMKRRQIEPTVLVGLRGIADLAGIRGSAADALRIGALTPISAIAASPEIAAAFPALATAAGLVATPQIRQMGTLGGNLCADTRCTFINQSHHWRRSLGFCLKKDGDSCLLAPGSTRCWAVSSSDLAPVLCSLGAQALLIGPAGQRVVAIADLYQDDGANPMARAPQEILAEVLLPPAQGWRSAYLKLRRRGSFDLPVLGVAVALRLEGDRVCDARIVMGGVASRPLAVPEAHGVMVGERLTADLIETAADLAAREARPLDNTDYPATYRKKMVRVYVRRALRQLAAFDPAGPPTTAR